MTDSSNGHLMLRPPAKVNLWLEILGRREDGYHEIETRMCPISLRDELEIALEPDGGVRFACEGGGDAVPVGEDNLVMQAVRAFERRTHVEVNARITLTKKIPSGAGLGGGSSDAASVLLGLNELLGTGMEREELAAVGAELGSDIPFFVYESVCDCRGRGESVVPVEFEWELPMVLVKPAFGVAASWAYGRWADSRELPGVTYAPQLCYWGQMGNDLERPVFEKYLLLAEMKKWLLAQKESHAVLMTGSGSTLLTVLSGEHLGGPLVEKIRARYGAEVWTFVGQSLAGRAGA
jgi:4-diphosphocytidyl-2-C-methyl-D-erythritol kinase